MGKREYRVQISRKNLDDVMEFYGITPKEMIEELGYENPQVWYKNRKEEKFVIYDIDLMAEYLGCDPGWIMGHDLSEHILNDGNVPHEILKVSSNGELVNAARFGYYHSLLDDAENLEKGHGITTALENVIQILADDYLFITDNTGNHIPYRTYLSKIKKYGLQPAVTADTLTLYIIEKINADSTLQYNTMQAVTSKKGKTK